MTKTNNFEEIKLKITPILKKHGVSKSYVFGSYARGDNNAHSDLDLLVQYTKPKTFFEIYNLEQLLKESVGLDVDLVSDKAIKKSVLPYIEKDLKALW